MDVPARAVFVGRISELAELECALDATQAASGTTVLVAGEAGIGKTSLASELATRARGAGFEVLLGRSLDLVGTELPYQPFVEALRPLGELRRVEAGRAASQLRVFEETLALLAERAASVPVLLVLEDLHWADASTLDLVVFLAHNLGGQRILLVATYRGDELESVERVRRLADGVLRSGSALALDLGPLAHEELTTLLMTHAGAPLPAVLTNAIAARAEGNPFFAEELLGAADSQGGELPLGLRDLLLRRVAQLDPSTQSLLRLAGAAGRDVRYPLLCAAAAVPEPEVRESLRRAVDHRILVAEQAKGSFRFRHALLAEAIYTTILPGEREELHARLAQELARSGAASPAELAPHWAAAGRSTEALAASVEAARQAEAVFGLAEAEAHLERALALWPEVPDAAALAGLDLAELCTWTAELAAEVGAAPRAVELGRRAVELVGAEDPHRAALLHVRLGEYLYAAGSTDALLAAFERAVELVPADPPSPERAYALGSLAGGLMVAWRHAESLPIGERALALARDVGAGKAEVRALTVLGGDLAYLGRAEEGLAHFREALPSRWRTPTRLFKQGWLGRTSARLRRSASNSAPRDCAHRQSWQRSHAPAGTPMPSATGRAEPESCSPALAAPLRQPRRSRLMSPDGSPWPRPRMSAPAATLCRGAGRMQPPPGTASNVPRSPPTVAGARPRRWSPPAHPAPQRACRSGMHMPLRRVSERPPYCTNSSCWPSERGSIRRPKRRPRPRRSTACRTPSD